MNTRSKEWLLGALMLLLIGAMTASLFFDAPYDYAQEYLGDTPLITGLVYTLLVFLTTVVAPLAALPLAPAVSVIIGPFFTALASIIGWTLGAIAAFLIARHAGRPLLEKFVDLRKIKKYEAYIPEHNIFVWLVVLRMIVPVDILSYAIGLLSSIRLPIYTLATFVGVVPFSFILSYGGNALLERDLPLFVGIGALGVLVFLVVVYGYLQNKKRP